MTASEGSGLFVGNNLAKGLNQSEQQAHAKPLDWEEDGGTSKETTQPPSKMDFDQEGDDPRLQRR